MKTYTAGTLSGNLYPMNLEIYGILASRIRRINDTAERGIFFPTTSELKRVIEGLGNRVVYLGY